MEVLSSRGVDIIPISKRSVKSVLKVDVESNSSSSSDDVQHISSSAAIMKPINKNNINNMRSKLQSNIANSFEPEEIEVEPELVALGEDDDDDDDEYYNDEEISENGYHQNEQDAVGNYGMYNIFII